MAVQPRFCGHCGAQVPPDAPYCGRCGAPQAPLVVATPAAYAYPSATPRRRTGIGRISGAQIAVAAGLLIVLSIVTVGLSAFAVSQVIGTRKPCTSNCGAKIVTPLPAPATYKSSAFGFEVDYDPGWTVRSQDSQGIILATKLGLLQVTGTKSGQPLQDLMQATVSALPSSTWQDVLHVTDLKGAHIGDQDGIGAVYSANLIQTNAKAAKVRLFVIAATKGGVNVVIFGVNPSDAKDFPNGIPEGQEFDALCQEFQWRSS
ncbi:MAG: hypothetical protein AUH40_09580 [Chloroflexi bacterium 13_1_40CM_65_17]|nr:MAG: hypothetical protein AUH40_09580 [Chloroflexi bacterium 13_1_40CM_65_17]